MHRTGSFSAFLVVFSGITLAQSAPVVTIYTHFENACSPAVGERIKLEVDEAMQAVGIEFEWRELDSQHASEPVDELVVLKFKGRCSVETIAAQRSWTGALGWTHVSDGHLLPFADIDCDRTWRFIRSRLIGVSEEEQTELLGRALGRVVAHELYHILANTIKHASGGMAKGCYTVADLTADRLEFGAREIDLIRNGKLRMALQRQRRPAIAATAAGE